MMEWPKLFDNFKSVFKFGGKNQKQSIKKSENVVASQSSGAPASSILQAQVLVERHGYARTPTELFGDFEHAIKKYEQCAGEGVKPPFILVNDWDIMIIQMLIRENTPGLRDRITLSKAGIAYEGVLLKHPTQGVLQFVGKPETK